MSGTPQAVSGGLSAGWIVALVALVLLTATSVYIFLRVGFPRRRRRVERADRVDSVYYELTRPARAFPAGARSPYIA